MVRISRPISLYAQHTNLIEQRQMPNSQRYGRIVPILLSKGYFNTEQQEAMHQQALDHGKKLLN